jgi:hypothetical protein
MRLVYMEEDYKFKCAECIFKCKKRGDYNRHLTTNKHIKIKEGKKIYNCKLCDKIYLNRSGLWRHNKVCNTGVKNDDYKELYIELLKEQNKLKNEISRVYTELLSKQNENENIMKHIINNMGTCDIIQQV